MSIFHPMSRIRKIYFLRLAARCAVLAASVIVYFLRPQMLNILHGFAFFDQFSVLHILWAVWMLDMLFQLIPIGKNISIGSLKMFPQVFKPIREAVNPEHLKAYILSTTRAAYRVMIVWVLLTAAIGYVHHKGLIDNGMLFVISVFFYVCDLICVLIWCPFRLMMRNRCCTTCRIFNWDHLMMFSPFLFVWSFYTTSLLLVSVAVVIVWEVCIFLHPERFWEYSNAALQCANCTDKLCTQYCQRLRKK